ncbi:S-layer homology domain-containing protein, partial [Patescibacteria group bacterium]|nr:S-layer homology domain-containing protein [Patescibacteria group bacterium]
MYTSMYKNLKRVFTAAVMMTFAFTLFAANAVVVMAAGSISSFGVSQSVFDPTTESLDIDFTLTESGYITLEILDNNVPINTLALTYGVAPGSYAYTWDGTDNDGNKVDEKEYEVQLFYYGSDFAIFENQIIKVDYVGGSTIIPNEDLLTNDYATPTSFDPSDGEDTDIHFTLSENAYVTMKIQTATGSLVKEILNANKNAGSYYATWNGRNANGSLVTAGSYKYVIEANTSGGDADMEIGAITVEDGTPSGTIPVITNDSANPTSFDPNDEDTTILFTLNTQSNVTVKIYKGTSLIDTITTNLSMVAGVHSVNWDGRNSSNAIVAEGTYTYKILAENSYGYDEETGSVVVDYGTVVTDDPVISNSYTSPTEFDPSEGEETIVHYTLNTCAYVTVTVYKQSTGAYVDTLRTNSYQCSGSHQEIWNGRNSGNDIVANGEYEIKIHAENSDGSDTEIETVSIVDDSNNSGDYPEITNVDVDPYTFDPSDNEETELTYVLDTCADITVKVYDDNDDLVVTLKDDVYQCSGTHSLYWDGEDRYNDEVEDGTYYFKITAVNDDGSDTASAFTRVDTGGTSSYTTPYITNVDVEDDSFDPYDDYTRLSFRLNTCADVTIEVRDYDNDTVREILNDDRLCSGTYDYVWNGKDDDRDYVREDDYEFYIYATNDKGSDSERIDVEVNYDSHTVDVEDRCAGFIDVDQNDPYCDAIEYVEEENIFDGYSDGSFRPYVSINRAETVKVILEGFDYSSMYANINFWDVQSYEWYYNYLRTAVYYRIIQGYPDGAFRPAQTVNRVELLKIFLEASDVYVPACYSSPYVDVPSNEWYTKYVCFAKSYDLMDADYFNNFNPDKP